MTTNYTEKLTWEQKDDSRKLVSVSALHNKSFHTGLNSSRSLAPSSGRIEESQSLEKNLEVIIVSVQL